MTRPPDDPNRRIEADATEQARVAADQLSRVNGPLELHAAVLALLLPPGSERAARAWQIECAAVPGAQTLRDSVASLPGAARLPWFEILLARLRRQPVAARNGLLEATRRLMAARGGVRPIDRLHWLAMRQHLGDAARASPPARAATSVSQMPHADVHAIALFSAFLSRMVPVAEVAAPSNPGATWYASVMAPWAHRAEIAPLTLPDTDAIVDALHTLQALAWMQRPVLARGWVSAAQQHRRDGCLSHSAADALRLTCTLLDSPLPPELARHYSAATPEAAP